MHACCLSVHSTFHRHSAELRLETDTTFNPQRCTAPHPPFPQSYSPTSLRLGKAREPPLAYSYLSYQTQAPSQLHQTKDKQASMHSKRPHFSTTPWPGRLTQQPSNQANQATASQPIPPPSHPRGVVLCKSDGKNPALQRIGGWRVALAPVLAPPHRLHVALAARAGPVRPLLCARKQGGGGGCLFQPATCSPEARCGLWLVSVFVSVCFTACPRGALTCLVGRECVGLFLDVERWDPSEVHYCLPPVSVWSKRRKPACLP